MGEFKELVYSEKEKRRIDKFLSENFKISRERIKKLMKEGEIIVNSKKVEPSYKLQSGDVIKILSIEDKESISQIKPQKKQIEIIYEDKDIIVVNKPAGILTHPTNYTKTGTLLNYVLYHTTLSRIGSPLRCGVIHRLDRETSGVIIFARTDFAYWNLIEQFKNRQIEKFYLSIVEGKFKPEKKVVEFTVMPDREEPTKMKVHFLKGKKAITEIKVMKYIDNLSLLLVKPITGRTHQIRITLSYLGYPVIGDKKYGVESNLISRTALHSWKLTIFHPRKLERITFKAEIPEDMKKIIKKKFKIK